MRSYTLSRSVEGRGMSAGSVCRLGPREISCLDSEAENLVSAMVPLSWGQSKKEREMPTGIPEALFVPGS